MNSVRTQEARASQSVRTPRALYAALAAYALFVIASGTSDAHVRGIAESVIEKLGRRGHRTHHVEGLNGGRWVLLDFVDFVIHLVHPETRSFYQLERLWDDAPELLIRSTS